MKVTKLLQKVKQAAEKMIADGYTGRKGRGGFYRLAKGADGSRVKEAIDGKDVDLAIKLLDALIELRPEYVEAWNRRATLYYLRKDYVRAMADIRQVLAREPRHFGAISGLGMILQEFGDEKHALEAFRRAVAIHPHLQKIPEMIKTLSEKVEGRDI